MYASIGSKSGLACQIIAEMPCNLPRCALKDEFSQTASRADKYGASPVLKRLLYSSPFSAEVCYLVLCTDAILNDIAHHSALPAFHSAHFTNLVAPKVSSSLHSRRSCPVRESRCLDPDFGLAPIIFEVSIMDWYVALP